MRPPCRTGKTSRTWASSLCGADGAAREPPASRARKTRRCSRGAAPPLCHAGARRVQLRATMGPPSPPGGDAVEQSRLALGRRRKAKVSAGVARTRRGVCGWVPDAYLRVRRCPCEAGAAKGEFFFLKSGLFGTKRHERRLTSRSTARRGSARPCRGWRTRRACRSGAGCRRKRPTLCEPQPQGSGVPAQHTAEG